MSTEGPPVLECTPDTTYEMRATNIEVIITEGAWLLGNAPPSAISSGYLSSDGAAGLRARFAASLLLAGTYRVRTYWVAGEDRAPDVEFTLPLLLVLTLLGFVGSVSVARFSPGSDDVEAERS